MVFSIQVLDREDNIGLHTRRQLRMRNHLVNSPHWGESRVTVAAFRDILIANLLKGVTAARQIAVPALVVQGMMAALAISYFYVAPVKSAFESLVLFKNSVGMPFAFGCMGMIAVFAEVLRRQFDPASRGTPFWSNAAYGFVVFGFLGIATDAFYSFQGMLWGGLPPSAQVPAKVLTDQFIYTVLFANPYQTLLYVLKDCRFKPQVLWQRITPFKTFYVQEMLAVLVTNWAFWIPTTAILYSLPVDLQFVIAQLAITIWALLLTAMTKRD